MAAKKKAKKSSKKEKKELTEQEKQEKEMMDKLPPEAKEKLLKIKKKLEKFQEKVMEKFEEYVIGISLLPPQEGKEVKKEDKDKINVIILIDDSDSQKMSKYELKEKLSAIMASIAKEIDENIQTQTIILSELWQNCYDSQYDLLQMIAVSAPIFDKGMMQACKIAEIHKNMTLKKFEKYIVSYVLFGSLVRGEATPESDIDVAIIIDDTDVKKMTRAELKDRLRSIIIGMGVEAGQMTGIKNKLNIQVYILTDFWDSVKEANPVIFTILRDGIPFYDRGVFMPWKQLLRMGKIKPSAEAIDMFMNTGEEMLKRVQGKLNEIGMEDVFWSILTPSQAALMMNGIAPPTPRETPKLLREVFVKKEKIFDDKHVKFLEEVIKLRKELEYATEQGKELKVSGEKIDHLLSNSRTYLDEIKKLFTKIEEKRSEQDVLHIYENTVTIIRDIMRLENVERMKDEDEIRLFKSEVVNKGLIPEKYFRMLNEIVKAKADFDAGKLTKPEVEKVKKQSGEFMRFMIEYLQRKRGRELERTKIRVKHGEKHGEVILLGKTAFIIHDIDQEEKTMSKAPINEDGSLGTPENATLEELEKALATVEIPERAYIKQPIFNDLKRLFGKDVEVLVQY